jgi:nicotinate phosphoribosyltransferase
MTAFNHTMLCDLYELTMANGYLAQGREAEIGYFDVFFRRIPDAGGFVIAAGLEQAINYVRELRFTEEDLAYLQSLRLLSYNFLHYLRHFSFSGDIFAVPEGSPIFPQEPIMIVRAPLLEAQIMETFLLLALNHQSLIATKAARMMRAAGGRAILEFGARCAPGVDASVLGARAAFIGGCAGTSCVMSGRDYHLPLGGTMAHSWVQIFDDELASFRAYCALYPENATLLVDTYDVLNSGVPHAIQAFEEILRPQGIKKCGIRIDSGDIAALSIAAREMLDAAGWPDCKIVASNALDERLITGLLQRGARIDTFGVGECLITAKSDPALGLVYKLAAQEDAAGIISPRIKLSATPAKLTTPHYKKVYRLYDRATGRIAADYVCIYDETLPETIIDPVSGWTGRTADFTARGLLTPIFREGRCVYSEPALPDIQAYCREQVAALPEAVRALDTPATYPVILSSALARAQQELIQQHRRGGEGSRAPAINN